MSPFEPERFANPARERMSAKRAASAEPKSPVLPEAPPHRRFAMGRTLLAMAFLAAVGILAVFHWSLPQPAGIDDVNWAMRSLQPWWYPHERVRPADWPDIYLRCWQSVQFPNDTLFDYFFSIDHPALARIVYREMLHAMGVEKVERPIWDFSKSMEWNKARRWWLPPEVLRGLRLTNAAFFIAGLMCAYLSLRLMLRSDLLAMLAALPIALEATISQTAIGAVSYIGADAILLFCLLLMHLAWVRLSGKGVAAACLVGALGGLATAAKVNGAFAVAGFCAFLILESRGWRRLTLPLAAGVSSLAVFFALNPVLIGPGPSWTITVIRDMLQARVVVNEWIMARPGTFTKAETILALFPYVYLAVPIAAVLTYAGRVRHMKATAFWAVPFIIGNLAGAATMMPRYAAPLRVAFLMVFMPCGVLVLRDAWEAGYTALKATVGRPTAARATGGARR